MVCPTLNLKYFENKSNKDLHISGAKSQGRITPSWPIILLKLEKQYCTKKTQNVNLFGRYNDNQYTIKRR